MSSHALSAISTLQHHGYQAYLVGGCVRDGLMGVQPKDFDVVTNAQPKEILSIFNRAFIVGKRFPIVHVNFKHHMIEITTFRRILPAEQSGLLMTTDCAYGHSLEEDALRRDFTCNALYYDPVTGLLYDPFNALNDIQQRHIVTIGDPLLRFQEDPVRVLRLVRFMAKHHYHASPQLIHAASQSVQYLTMVAPARLHEENNKMFLKGYSRQVLSWLLTLKALPFLYPSLTEANVTFDTMYWWAHVCCCIDTWYQQTAVDPAYWLSAILWVSLPKTFINTGAWYRCAKDIMLQQKTRTMLTKKMMRTMLNIWHTQYYITRYPHTYRHYLSKRPNKAWNMAFLSLRCQIFNPHSL
jgi:poly(A) polymerase